MGRSLRKGREGREDKEGAEGGASTEETGAEREVAHDCYPRCYPSSMLT